MTAFTPITLLLSKQPELLVDTVLKCSPSAELVADVLGILRTGACWVQHTSP